MHPSESIRSKFAYIHFFFWKMKWAKEIVFVIAHTHRVDDCPSVCRGRHYRMRFVWHFILDIFFISIFIITCMSMYNVYVCNAFAFRQSFSFRQIIARREVTFLESSSHRFQPVAIVCRCVGILGEKWGNYFLNRNDCPYLLKCLSLCWNQCLCICFYISI